MDTSVKSDGQCRFRAGVVLTCRMVGLLACVLYSWRGRMSVGEELRAGRGVGSPVGRDWGGRRHRHRPAWGGGASNSGCGPCPDLPTAAGRTPGGTVGELAAALSGIHGVAALGGNTRVGATDPPTQGQEAEVVEYAESGEPGNVLVREYLLCPEQFRYPVHVREEWGTGIAGKPGLAKREECAADHVIVKFTATENEGEFATRANAL